MADRLVCVISWSDRSVRASSGKRGILFSLNFFYINSALNYPLFYVYCVNIHTGLQHRAGPTTVKDWHRPVSPPKKLWNYPHLLILRLIWSRCSVYFIKILFL